MRQFFVPLQNRLATPIQTYAELTIPSHYFPCLYTAVPTSYSAPSPSLTFLSHFSHRNCKVAAGALRNAGNLQKAHQPSLESMLARSLWLSGLLA